MSELRVWPSVVRFKVGGSYIDGGGIVDTFVIIKGAIDGFGERSIVQSIILSITTNAYVGFRTGDITNVI